MTDFNIKKLINIHLHKFFGSLIMLSCKRKDHKGSQVLALESSTNKHDKKPIMLFKAAQIWYRPGHTRLPINARSDLTTGLLTRCF